MTTTHAADPATVICAAAEGVFATVAEVRRLTLDRHAAAVDTGRPFDDADVSGLAPAFVELLEAADQLAVGLGIILEPGTLPGHPLRLEWWQRPPGRDAPVPLEVDLHPDSIGFYDYTAADWFAVPRRTRARHVVGPYVDVHGTDRYLLTLTMPIEVAGRFLGVAGADVPITGFETMVLRGLGGSDAILANDEGRVVVSTSSRWITGCLLPQQRRRAGVRLSRLPWELIEPPLPEPARAATSGEG
ncbi:cache domain-containing protein [Nocardioides sp. YIM 152315]|uniref:cache domain-containing protein n=1 Tax=Nocardioides sp. YIM 152315 TaxID=3031760 RepID=UPI0023DB53A4|nr:cache domain-containing protein [Nocardioides sp. YIM 152315]MDF1602170.1 cache domain-containing protein [Nocardioides sp. YIM 152315]